MTQVDIARLYKILAEHETLDPETARKLLCKILQLLKCKKGKGTDS